MKLGIVLIPAFALTAACAVEEDPFDRSMSLLAQMGDQGGNLEILSVDDLPDSAQLNGVYAVHSSSTKDRAAYYGNSSATADFAKGTLTGTASNFGEYDAVGTCNIDEDPSLSNCTGELLQSLDGTIEYTGVISGTSFVFSSSGVLSGKNLANDTPLEAQIQTTGAGGFAGYQGNIFAAGVHSGSITYSNGDPSLTNMDGILILTE